MKRTVAAALLAFSIAAVRGQAETAKLNVVLVSLDQLRADHLHCYGYRRQTSPNIDRMAKEGVLFKRMYAASPWTTPSYVSIMTSLYPSRHGLTLFNRPGAPTLDSDKLLLAELFKSAGYKTVAFVNNANAGRRILGRGFDEFYEGQRGAITVTERERQQAADFTAPATNEKIFAWLQKHGGDPFFMFVLYWEPHSPYDPPPEHDIFKTDAYPDLTHTGYDPERGRLLRLATIGDRKAIERLNSLYDGKIHFVDFHFGRLLQKLRSLGLDRKTLVVLTSDHGELLYEHPEDFNSFDHRSLYDAVMRIPLIMACPAKLPRGKVIEAMVTHLDIAPTILELAGLGPKPDAQGRSLLPLISGKAEQINSHVYGEQDILVPLRSVRDARYKLIYNLRTKAKQLFDVVADPRELKDLAAQKPDVVQRLWAKLEAWIRENQMPEEKRRRLWQETVRVEPPETIVDEVTIGARLQLNGPGWKIADNERNFRKGCFWVEAGDGRSSALWRNDNPMPGLYRIWIWYGSLPGVKLATNAPFTIETEHGSKEFRIDLNSNAGQWNLLDTVNDPIGVKLTNAADGPVLADAVKFERVD